MSHKESRDLHRRDFLKTAAAVTGGAALGWSVPRVWGNEASGSNGVPRRTLGRTGLRISEIGFGGYPVKDPDVVRYAIDQGINYFDTAWDYTGGWSERTIGEGIRGRREEVIITTKWHPWSDTPAEQMMEMLNTSLKRLQTDYVDCLLVHQVGRASGGESIERLTNPELFKAMEQARRQGKARYFGCSGHDGDLMEVMDYAITIPEFSVILCRYNFLSYPNEAELFRRAKARGVGSIAMKTLSGARGADLSPFRDKHTSYKQAALKWVLSNSDLSGLVISISNKRQVDEYVQASRGPLSARDYELLDEYAARFGRQVCRMCNACEPACPGHVQVADILRYRMYEKEYGLAGEGRRLYRERIARHFQNACLGCPAPCLDACPHGIDIPGELHAAHRILT